MRPETRLDAGHRRLFDLLGLAIFFEGYGPPIVSVTLRPIRVVLGVVTSIGSALAAFLLGFIGLFPGGWRGLCLLSLCPVGLIPFLPGAIPESRRWTLRAPRCRQLLPRAYRGRMLAGLAVFFLGMSYDVAGFAFTAFWPM